MTPNKPKVFVTLNRTPETVLVLDEHFDVEVWDGATSPPKSVLKQKAATHDAFLTEIDDLIDSEVLDSTAKLTIVANRGAGLANIDVPAATSNGVLVCNIPDVNQETCADVAFGLMLAAAGQVLRADRTIRRGDAKIFQQTQKLGFNVYGKTLGIVGLGRIGSAVARRSIGFDMSVLYHSRNRKEQEETMMRLDWRPRLQQLLAESDFLTFHVPLTDLTRNMIGRRELNLMKRNAVVVNCACGPVIDIEALYEALSEGHIAAAALDLVDDDYIPDGHPLLAMDNVVLTPNISRVGSIASEETDVFLKKTFLSALSGDEVPSCVNPEARGGDAKVSQIASYMKPKGGSKSTT